MKFSGTNPTVEKFGQFYLTCRKSYDGRDLFIMSKTENITIDAIDAYYLPYLEMLRDHAKKGGYFYTYGKEVVYLNGEQLLKIYASKDVFTIAAKVRKLTGIDKGEGYHQIFRATKNTAERAIKEGYAELI